MIRLGLCCAFKNEPIRFRTLTATALARLPKAEQQARLVDACAANAAALAEALRYCAGHNIGCFRINSQILPLATHPAFGYELGELPGGEKIVELFRACGASARTWNLRTTFHPDQFVVLNSPREQIVRNSVQELIYQARVAEWVGADVINIHGGGAFGDKPAALLRLATTIEQLPDAVRCRLTMENDDRIYTPSDLAPWCRTLRVPLVYDVHHHRCQGDGLSEESATELALATWNREPLVHISSPAAGWEGPQPRRHHEYIDAADFPRFWQERSLTIEVEAKGKELAVARLQNDLGLVAMSPAPPQRIETFLP